MPKLARYIYPVALLLSCLAATAAGAQTDVPATAPQNAPMPNTAPGVAPAASYPFTGDGASPGTPIPTAAPAADPSTASSIPDPVMEGINQVYAQDAAPPAQGAGRISAAPQDSLSTTVLRAVFGLAVVCALVLLAGNLVRRYGKNTPLLAGAQLGALIGRMYLAPKTALYFVRVANRVLVIGVNAGAITPIAEFSSEEFEAWQKQSAAETTPHTSSPFAGQLRTALSDMQAPLKHRGSDAVPKDDEIDALRQDVQRLQRYLGENNRDRAE